MKTQEQRKESKNAFRRQRVLATLAAVALLLGSLWFAEALGPKRTQVFASAERGILVIDPGHGGIDGGAVAYNGVKESELNLAIALKLRDLAEFFGVETRMTRQDDSARTEPESYSEREDLACRAQLAEETENGVLISIPEFLSDLSAQRRSGAVRPGSGEPPPG